MKALWLRVLSAFIVLMAAPVMLGVFAFCLPPQYGETFLGALKDKYNLLDNAPGQRIVIIGGSGVAFGQRSDLLEAELPGYTVVNFGMYAGLGTTVMLELAQPLLQAGDVVIFSPEQSPQTLSDYFNAEAMWQAADGKPELLLQLDDRRWGSMVGAFPAFAAAKYRFFRDGAAPRPEGVYSRSAFNAHGDIVYDDRQKNIMMGGYDPNMLIDFAELPGADFLQVVNAFAEDCLLRGIRFFYRFAPMNRLAVHDEALEAYTAALREKLACPILGDPHDALMDAAWFYDTNFHLNESGAIMHTIALAEDIKAALGMHDQVAIAMPSMPTMDVGIGLSTGSGAALASGDFLYEIVNGAIRLTGLSEAGAQQRQLTIPGTINGKAVTSFAPTVFAGNHWLEEVVIPASVTRIENGSFAGCTALERIILQQPAPEKCSVGEQLLAGTPSMVLVPQESVGAYMTNYFWSIHASRIMGTDMPDIAAAAVAPSPVPQEAASTQRIVTYHANGGQYKNSNDEVFTQPINNSHLRVNTAQGTRYLERDGYILVGWNTHADGSGTAVGLGSRIERADEMTLFAQWAKENPAEDFTYRTDRREVHITGYLGASAHCVVPAKIEGLPVRRIVSGAFQNAPIDTLVLPPSMTLVERNAFTGSTVREITLFDGLYGIYDESFADCRELTTLHIQAMVSPVYSASYFAAFADKYDWLLSIAQEKKIVLFSGSSGRYGYDSVALREAFPEFQIANMGVYAYTNAMPQLALIRPLMRPGDVLLSAPEFDTVNNQFCTTNRLDPHFWAMMEANYDAAAALDLRQYSGVFDSLCSYLTARTAMGSLDYSVSPASFDDDGHAVASPTYNQYGDYILPRLNAPKDELLQWGLADYTVDAFPQTVIEGLNDVYRRFLEDGVTVYFTYTPRNIRAITLESTLEARRILHSYLVDQLCVPVISDIEESLYPGTLFYLIDSHLSTEGVVIRTERIIEDLKKQFREKLLPERSSFCYNGENGRKSICKG